MKKIAALLLLIILDAPDFASACTTFFLHKNGQLVFGKNYDWTTSTGMVNTNLRGLQKSSLAPDRSKSMRWTSKYGSVTFNQYGKEFPNGGMNEKGLVVELMWLSESEYPAADNRAGISVLQWIQYQLDNCSTVDEVIATDKLLRVVSTGTPQHYLVADRKGGVATIEFLNGKMVVHKGKDLPHPVLTNSTYASSVSAIAAGRSSNKATTFNDNSIARFAKACSMVAQYKQADIQTPLVDYSFNILTKVSSGNFTKWNIVYDISNGRIYFKTLGNKQVKSFELNSFDYACNATPMSFDINQNSGGNISKKFAAYSGDVNNKMLNKAFNESKGQVEIPDELKKGVAAAAAGVKCS